MTRTPRIATVIATALALAACSGAAAEDTTTLSPTSETPPMWRPRPHPMTFHRFPPPTATRCAPSR